MPTIGSGLVSLSQDIHDILVQEHKKHQAYDEALGLADALSRIGIDKRTGAPVQIQYDEKGKIVNGESIQAFADPKMLDAYRQYNRRNAAQSAGALSALSRIMAAGIARSQSEAIDRSYNVPTTIGGQTFSLSQPQAASVAAQQEASKGRTQQQAFKNKLALSAENRARRGEVREEKRLAISQKTSLEKAPERQFMQKYGLTPQSLIGLQEGNYEAVNEKGSVIGENEPLAPGETVKDYTKKPGWIKELVTLGYAEPSRFQWRPKEGSQVFREMKLKYPASAKEQRPAQERFAVNPEGEFLNIRGTRVPVDQVRAIQNQAETVRAEALRKIQANPQNLPIIRERLAEVGYNPNDPFWGLPER